MDPRRREVVTHDVAAAKETVTERNKFTPSPARPYVLKVQYVLNAQYVLIRGMS